MAVNEELKLPTESPLHGCLAQGRSEPTQVTIFEGWTRLTTSEHGEMTGAPLQGYFCGETQFLTCYRLRVNGEPLKHRFAVQTGGNQWVSVGYVAGTTEDGDLAEGVIPRGSLEVTVQRFIQRALAERISVTNNDSRPRQVELELRLGCPVEDGEFREEMKRDESSAQRGRRPTFRREGEYLVLRFARLFGFRARTPEKVLHAAFGNQAPRDGQPVVRLLDLRMRGAPGTAPLRLGVKPGRTSVVKMTARLAPRARAAIELFYDCNIDGQVASAPRGFEMEPIPRAAADVPADWPRVIGGNSSFNLVMAQALSDLNALKLPVFGSDLHDRNDRWARAHDGYIAGVPRYVGVFSRDTMITAWQAALFETDQLESSLARLALFQGKTRNRWRDEQPGRLPHERRLNPNSATGQSNRALYYGDVAATPLWIVALACHHYWTGSTAALRRFEATFEGCVSWILRELERGDGFLYYQPLLPHSRDANRNQAWKDSGDAVVDAQGRVQLPPLALCEIQGYVYEALCQGARIRQWLGRPDAGSDLLETAARLKDRFNEKFWMEGPQFYAFGLGRGAKVIDAIASNPGHLLGTGIVPPERARPVVRRLLEADMFSGWGVRTLSTENPAYDPFSYHRGTVWPVENATIAEGMGLCGFHDEANHIIASMLSLATMFQHMRLPEVFSGHPRSKQYPAPGVYPYANPLQAWSASAMLMFPQVIAGLHPDAPNRTLYVRPALPDWLPWLEIRGLKVGAAKVSLRFDRESEARSAWRVIEQQGELRIVEGRRSDPLGTGGQSAA